MSKSKNFIKELSNIEKRKAQAPKRTSKKTKLDELAGLDDLITFNHKDILAEALKNRTFYSENLLLKKAELVRILTQNEIGEEIVKEVSFLKGQDFVELQKAGDVEKLLLPEWSIRLPDGLFNCVLEVLQSDETSQYILRNKAQPYWVDGYETQLQKEKSLYDVMNAYEETMKKAKKT